MNWFGNKSKAIPAEGTQPTGFDDFEVRLGDIIRGERATMGKSLLDVQRELHIRATYIAAIEAGDLSAFEAPSFVAGYVRSYARYLGLDPDWCYRQFCSETNFSINSDLDRSQPAKPVAKPVMAGELSQGLLSRTRLADDPDPFWRRVDIGGLGSVAVVLALVAGLGYGGWTVLKEVQRVQLAPADQSPDVMADLDPVMTGSAPSMERADNVGPLQLTRRDSGASTSLPADTAQGVVRTYQPEALDAPVMVARDGPIGAIRPEPEEPDTDALSDAIGLALNEATEDAPEVRVLQDGPPVVEVLAVRPSWIRVRASDGTVLFEKVLDAGERYTVPQTEEAANLRAGNSGSVYLLVDGQPYGPTAPGAQVVDSIALSPSAVTEAFQTADLTGDADLRNFVNLAEAPR